MVVRRLLRRADGRWEWILDSEPGVDIYIAPDGTQFYRVRLMYWVRLHGPLEGDADPTLEVINGLSYWILHFFVEDYDGFLKRFRYVN